MVNPLQSRFLCAVVVEVWFRTGRRWCLGLAVLLGLTTHCWANDLVSMYVQHGQPAEHFKENLERQAKMKVTMTSTACGLSEEQVQRLQQAAQGDVSRVLHELAALRHATEGINTADQQAMQKAFQIMQPATARLQAGLHGKGSLFAKYLEHTLDEPQRKRYHEHLAEQERQRNHLIALNTVAAIDQRVPLLIKQREKLIELIEKGPLPKQNRNLDASWGYMILGGVPEGQLNEFLDAEQTKFIIKICAPYQALRGVAP